MNVVIPVGGSGKEIVTYAASLASTSSAETNLTVSGMTKIVQIAFRVGAYKWSYYTDDGTTWRDQQNNSAISLPSTIYPSSPYFRFVSVTNNVIRYATDAAGYISVIGYKE